MKEFNLQMIVPPFEIQEAGHDDETSSCIGLCTYIEPFGLILAKDDEWKCTREEIVTMSYDYSRLSALSGLIRISYPFDTIIVTTFDGGLIVPLDSKLHSAESASQFFNDVFATLLFGRLNFMAVTPADLIACRILKTGHTRHLEHGASIRTLLRDNLRNRISEMDATFLDSPIQYRVGEFRRAIEDGAKILNKLPGLSGSLLIAAAAHYFHGEYSECLADSWIVVEQMIDHLWQCRVISQLPNHASTSRRREFVQDNRSWPISNRVELLHRLKILDETTHESLWVARRARNMLVHKGVLVSREHSREAIVSAMRLVALAINEERPHAFDHIWSTLVGEHPSPKKAHAAKEVDLDSGYWVKLPPLPGERGWGGEVRKVYIDNVSDD